MKNDPGKGTLKENTCQMVALTEGALRKNPIGGRPQPDRSQRGRCNGGRSPRERSQQQRSRGEHYHVRNTR